MRFSRSSRSVVATLLYFCTQGYAKYAWQNDAHWVDTWTSMPQLTELYNLPPAPYNQTGAVFVNSTIRQTLHLSLGGSPIRIRISNAFGTTDLPITAVTVALPTNNSAGVSTIQTSTLHTVTFSGSKNYTIPNGALVVSDPIPISVAPQSNLAVSIYLQDGQVSDTNAITSHPGSRTTSWMSMGNQVGKEDIKDASTESVAHWFFVSAVEVARRDEDARGFVIVGDSITDGRGSDTDMNDRWPDLVLARMQKNPETNDIAVLNQAAGGNRVLYDGLGPNALGRIDRDVLSHSSISYAMIFEGVNDIGTASVLPSSQSVVGTRLIAAFSQIITRLHAQNIPVFAATITPFSAPGYNTTAQVYSDPEREKTRQRVNAYIRSGVFDAVIDFDKVIRNESHPEQIQVALQGGDWLHPNAMGYKAMANAFPLGIF